MTTHPTTAPPAGQVHRAAGVLLAAACGDALGVPYEFRTPPTGKARMAGGGLGPYAQGEWSDDTQMAVCIAQVAATGADLTTPAALDAVANAFETWRDDAKTDIGTLTSTVLYGAARRTGSPAQRLHAAAAAEHARHRAHRRQRRPDAHRRRRPDPPHRPGDHRRRDPRDRRTHPRRPPRR